MNIGLKIYIANASNENLQPDISLVYCVSGAII
jgi:hypothetical protein